ncbi:MAG TPA: hypothetical protein VHC69_29965 [Polyangiaceae bacterium]|nr:hypothetical protein [Polyangiaceae bacterium]
MPTSAVLVAAGVTVAGVPDAHAASTDAADDHSITVHSETRADLFRRAPLPGPEGAIVETQTLLPIRETLLLRALDLDTPVGRDSVDLELSAWGAVVAPAGAPAQSPDGDVQTAYVRLHRGPVSLRLGRQVVAGGAARYARFDGAMVDAAFGAGFDVGAYGGLTALPRWDERPAYYNLGASSDVALRNPSALPPSGRSGYALGGARFGWSNAKGGAQVSFHEQHDAGALDHRSLGADAQLRPVERLALFADAILELDARRLSDARGWIDATPFEPLDVSFEYRHTEPSLLLSRTSVLSVFSTSAYDETGVFAKLTATRRVAVDASGFAQIYDGSRPGGRGDVAVTFVADRARRTLLRLSYARLVAPENGYHSSRASVSERLLPPLTLTVESYLYWYDHAVRGYRTSSVFAGTLGFRPRGPFGALLASSLAESPYARLDAQAMLQLSCDLDFSGRRRSE